jgi:hypothetical protein
LCCGRRRKHDVFVLRVCPKVVYGRAMFDVLVRYGCDDEGVVLVSWKGSRHD